MVDQGAIEHGCMCGGGVLQRLVVRSVVLMAIWVISHAVAHFMGSSFSLKVAFMLMRAVTFSVRWSLMAVGSWSASTFLTAFATFGVSLRSPRFHI